MDNFRPAGVQEYAHWIVKWLDSGSMPTHFYGYPFERNGMVVPLQPFRVNGECGARARSYLVHESSYFLGGNLGHNKVFLFEGVRALAGPSYVPVYNNPEFQGLDAEVDQLIREGKRRSDEWSRRGDERRGARRRSC